MFDLKNFLTVILAFVFCLFLQVVPAYAAIQTGSENFANYYSTVEYDNSDMKIESIHAPPRIVLTTEENNVVETFYPEEILENLNDEINSEIQYTENNNYNEEILDETEENLPLITLTVEDDLVVETFYPSANDLEISEKTVIPPQNFKKSYDDVPPTLSIISLSLDGSNDVQYLE